MSIKKLDKILSEYGYDLPDELIALSPASPRDAARLMIYDRATGNIKEDIFRNITKYLPQKSVLVFNETKVIPARLEVMKLTGGKVRILFIGIENKLIKVLSPKKLRIGEMLSVSKNLHFIVHKKDDRFWLLRPSFPIKNIYNILDKYGEMPIPPYIKKFLLTKSELKKEYQTIFAKRLGSVAAPTAALHFTNKLLNKIKASGHKVVFVTLHVNLGTFAPLTEDNLRLGKLHKEYYEISASTVRVLNDAKKLGCNIIAVGTTSLRALESSARNNKIHKSKGVTDIFIRPSYAFKFVDSLITNFHVPHSSLLMLVASMTGRDKLMEIYSRAIARRFRFFSFGDGMLII